MKKLMMAAAVVMGLMSCGDQSADEKATADSMNMTDANQAPMGGTTGMINNNTGNYPTDTSNQNGDDSIKGTSPASRSTTPRNANNQSNNNGGM